MRRLWALAALCVIALVFVGALACAAEVQPRPRSAGAALERGALAPLYPQSVAVTGPASGAHDGDAGRSGCSAGVSALKPDGAGKSGLDRVPDGLPAEIAELWKRAVGARARNRSAALLVSRSGFARLRAFRSWQDLAALRDYLDWADRPEAVGLDGSTITAHVSANDLILLRLPAEAVRASVRVLRDPIGYAVIDPPGAGWVRIDVEHSATAARVPDFPADFPTRAVPVIDAAVLAAPDIVTLYGDALEGKQVKVIAGSAEGELLYVSRKQINARVPAGSRRVAVEVDGMRSDWAEVEP